jgi:hypothetical protein
MYYDQRPPICPHCKKTTEISCIRGEWICRPCKYFKPIPEEGGYRKYMCGYGKKAKKSASRTNKHKRRSSTSRKRKSSKGKRV